ncbi:MAG TPA: 16S rRNA (cytosine(967)-C(5))-methyltransferase RsmB [Firmicutes bacterium]|jgi:16S rRNA (cytosine967-C5)-methyltransferase|nr:16S rRNA (cytosine(967)-C(5))-methyltransferase RsmB [Bacillota bacterium]
MPFNDKNNLPAGYAKGDTSARSLALEVLKEVEEREAYLNLVLNRTLSSISLSDAERSLFTELAYGVMQRRNTLDWALSLYLNRPVEKLTIWIRNILRMGVYQLLYLPRIPDSAAVDEAVKLAYRYGHRGVAGLVNAVLRKVSAAKASLPWPSREEKPALYLSLRHSYPLWMVERWIENMGLEEAEAFCAAGNMVPPLTVRTNTLKLRKAELKKRLENEGVSAEDLVYAPDGLHLKLNKRLVELESFREGLFQVQGESSMLVAPLLNPQPGESVLDLCSAPGGKAVHLGILMQNRGNIVAADLYPQRLKLVQDAARRQGIDIINIEKLDGRSVDPDKEGAFQRVLADVPCSGLGVIRRKGDLKWRRRPEDISSLSELQLQLLKGAFKYLCRGGVLLYSACTTEPEETTGVIEKFLAAEPSAKPVMLSPLLPEKLRGEEKREGMLYLWPHKHNLDGFFLARIRKK